MSLSRRAWLGKVLQGLGLSALVSHRPVAARAAGNDPSSNESGPLTARVTRPYDAETPVREFTSFLTPNHRFFVRSHFGPPAPEQIAEANWRLRVGGLIEQPLVLTLK